METDVIGSLKVLMNGGVILYPTDTIWGLGCDATNEAAIERVYKIKRRKMKRSMLILLSSFDQVKDYVTSVPEVVKKLIESADNPVTIIYPFAQNLPGNLISEEDTVGIRVTNDPFCSELINRFGKPIVSTSANLSGDKTPANFSEIDNQIVLEADFVVRWKQNDRSRNVPSAIYKVNESDEITIIRK